MINYIAGDWLSINSQVDYGEGNNWASQLYIGSPKEGNAPKEIQGEDGYINYDICEEVVDSEGVCIYICSLNGWKYIINEIWAGDYPGHYIVYRHEEECSPGRT